MEKIKLAFICKFSNAEIRRHQTIKDFRFENFLLALLKKEKKKVNYGAVNSGGVMDFVE